MNLTNDYYYLKTLARKVRVQHGLTSPRVTQDDLQRIYFKEGIEVDFWPYRLRYLRGAFFYDELGASVMVAAHLPHDPKVFTMAHELKHFLTDKDLGISYCDQSNIGKSLEIGAEIFAAELLLPDKFFVEYMEKIKVKRGQCDPNALVRLKVDTRTTLSYAGLAIKAEQLRYAPLKSLTRMKGWRKLEEAYRKSR
ncbi:MAG TPA: ImmA/IrrE family metallo-endopeptidase [Pyrinomonadaceae bacterium]